MLLGCFASWKPSNGFATMADQPAAFAIHHINKAVAALPAPVHEVSTQPSLRIVFKLERSCFRRAWGR